PPNRLCKTGMWRLHPSAERSIRVNLIWQTSLAQSTRIKTIPQLSAPRLRMEAVLGNEVDLEDAAAPVEGLLLLWAPLAVPEDLVVLAAQADSAVGLVA